LPQQNVLFAAPGLNPQPSTLNPTCASEPRNKNNKRLKAFKDDSKKPHKLAKVDEKNACASETTSGFRVV